MNTRTVITYRVSEEGKKVRELRQQFEAFSSRLQLVSNYGKSRLEVYTTGLNWWLSKTAQFNG